MFSHKLDTLNKKIGRVCFLNPQGYLTNPPPPLEKTDTARQTIYVLQLAEALEKKICFILN